ncbi:MAG: hypothetical protein K5894_12995 [Lachnospiraceae bacterium]|nr:hypothetical protein [Lachnospiraceae bacterium]
MSVKADKPEREYWVGIAVYHEHLVSFSKLSESVCRAAAKLRSNSLSDTVAHGVSHA